MPYVPVRTIAEQAGLVVDYNPKDKTVKISQPQTGAVETFKPGQYRTSGGTAYIEPSASRLLSQAMNVQTPTYPQLAGLPAMDEVIRRAQADYADAAQKGDRERMNRAHEAAEAARRIAGMIGGAAAQPAAAFSAVQSYGGKTFFDPLGYALQAAMRLPYAPGTPTLSARELMETTRSNIAKEALDRMQEERMRQEFNLRQQDLTLSEKRAQARAKLFNTFKQQLDEWWAKYPDGPSTQDVQSALNQISTRLWSTAPSAMTEGLTLDDIKDIEDMIRVLAGQQPRWKTNSAGGLDEQALVQQALQGGNAQ